MRKRLVIVGLLAATLLGCDSDEIFQRSEDAIADQGYTNIQYQGSVYFGCDSKDYYRLKYTAVSKTGRPVALVACSAPYKGVTVRTLR